MIAIIRKVFRQWWWEELVEWQRQVINQFLHLTGGALGVRVLSGHMDVFYAMIIVAVAWAAHEYSQWPSTRWYDPPLDWTFQILGLGLGYWWVT